MEHPRYRSILVYADGKIVTKDTLKLRKPHVKPDGYCRVGVDGHKAAYVHKLVWEAYRGEYDWRESSVDHVSGDKSDNRLENLQLLSRRDHALKTHTQNPDMAIKSGITRGRPVVRISDKEEIVFETQAIAARHTPGASQANISKCVLGKLGNHAGYKWRYHSPAGCSEEYWACPVRFSGVEVSSHGRIRTSQGKALIGNTQGGYAALRVAGQNVKVHALACETFHGVAPLQHTVDHLDGNPLNNTYRNLRWATGSQQACNRSGMMKVIATKDATSLSWDSFTAAGQHLGVSRKTVVRAVKSGACIDGFRVKAYPSRPDSGTV